MFSNKLSQQSRVWIYQSNRKFTDAEASLITKQINDFVSSWTAHKLQVEAEGLMLYNRFIVLAADEQTVGVSGCSIDSSVHFVKKLGNDFGVDFFDRWNIAYQNGDEIESCSREEFEKLAESGVINGNTIVFNNLVNTKSEFEQKWKTTCKESWLKSYLPKTVSV